jgi:hypothetical protein
MEDSAETERQLEILLAKREIVLDWPESENTERILQALDATIVKLESRRSSS